MIAIKNINLELTKENIESVRATEVKKENHTINLIDGDLKFKLTYNKILKLYNIQNGESQLEFDTLPNAKKFLNEQLNEIVNSSTEVEEVKEVEDVKSEELDYLIPTKANPLFIATCSDFGAMTSGLKDALVGGIKYDTFSCSLDLGIEKIHEFIKENSSELADNVEFTLYHIDGELDKYGEVRRTKAYSITIYRAKNFKLI